MRINGMGEKVGEGTRVCASCGSRKPGQHTMGCRVGIEKEALLTAQTDTSRREREAASPPVAGSAVWWLSGWTRADRVPPGIANYPRLAAERIGQRIRIAQRPVKIAEQNDSVRGGEAVPSNGVVGGPKTPDTERAKWPDCHCNVWGGHWCIDVCEPENP